MPRRYPEKPVMEVRLTDPPCPLMIEPIVRVRIEFREIEPTL